MKQVSVIPDVYFDSVFLMSVTTKVKQLPGIADGMIGLGTPANQEVIAAAGFDPATMAAAGPGDLVIALDAADQAAVDAALALANSVLHGEHTRAAPSAAQPLSLRGAVEQHAGANLALISVPGEYAAREAAVALELGLNVMLFSDNVGLEDEVELKRVAHARGLLVMGPDCGTSMLNGVPLGFANVVRRGAIGLVGASGTGMQEVMSLVDQLGGGVSQAIGIGSRDVGDAVGGITALDAIDALAADPTTEVVVFVSKPPAPAVAQRILARLADSGKAAVAVLLGQTPAAAGAAGIQHAVSLADAAHLAVAAAGIKAAFAPTAAGDLRQLAEQLAAPLRAPRRYVRGLFCGGTLAAEAMDVLADELGPVYATHARAGVSLALPDPHRSIAHTIVDLGDDAFTRGKPHPMIDPAERNERLLQEAADDELAVVLLDCVLGHGSHADPAGATAEAIAALHQRAPGVPVVVSVTGTDGDPQRLAGQRATLEQLGCTVLRSNHEAACVARGIIQTLATASGASGR